MRGGASASPPHGTMKENLFCKDMKIASDKFLKNYDAIKWEPKKVEPVKPRTEE